MRRRHDVLGSFNLSQGRFPVMMSNFLDSIQWGFRRSRSRFMPACKMPVFLRNVALAGVSLICFTPASATETARYGIAMYGEPALTSDNQNLPYANPDAPKGGRIVLALQGTFDSLNPLIVLGVAS